MGLHYQVLQRLIPCVERVRDLCIRMAGVSRVVIDDMATLASDEPSLHKEFYLP